MFLYCLLFCLMFFVLLAHSLSSMFVIFIYAFGLFIRRIYRLTLTTLDLLKYLQYWKVYFQLKSWYNDERNLKYYEKVG